MAREPAKQRTKTKRRGLKRACTALARATHCVANLGPPIVRELNGGQGARWEGAPTTRARARAHTKDVQLAAAAYAHCHARPGREGEREKTHTNTQRFSTSPLAAATHHCGHTFRLAPLRVAHCLATARRDVRYTHTRREGHALVYSRLLVLPPTPRLHPPGPESFVVFSSFLSVHLGAVTWHSHAPTLTRRN